jgi:hypothetical protein
MYQLMEDEPKLFLDLWNSEREVRKIQEILCPTGEGMKGVRLQGIGRLMISFKDAQINIVNLRSSEKQSFSWDELIELLGINDGMDGKERWSNIYKKVFPQGEIAPVQSQKPMPKAPETKTPEKKPEKRKESKVTKAKIKPKEEPKPVEEPKVEQKTEEQLPGQTSIEKNFPEYMPEPHPQNAGIDNEILQNESQFKENGTDIGENGTDTGEIESDLREVEETEEKKSLLQGIVEDISKKREDYKAAVFLRTEDANKNVEADMYLMAISELKEAIVLIEKLQQLEDYEARLEDE